MTERNAPVIRETVYANDSGKFRIRVMAGLRYMSGNSQPYFSLTADIREDRGGWWRDYGGGCQHQEILRLWPELAPLADLHLCDMDGAPLHAEANGWYWLAGALGGLGEEFHGANSPFPPRSEDDCMRMFAQHIRSDMVVARALAQAVDCASDPRSVWRTYCKAARGRWKREADAAIAAFGLVVFGDNLPKENGNAVADA